MSEEKRLLSLDELDNISGGTEPGDLTQEEFVRLIEHYEHEKLTFLAKTDRKPWEEEYLGQVNQRITNLSNIFARRFGFEPVTSRSV
ncbi:MAG: hypothetical protein IKX76_04515 [Eubacterium sp.]|nr:hypothetical protein [Eubacterium sp.]